MQITTSSQSALFNLRLLFAFILCSIGVSIAVASLTITVVPGTAVLLSKIGSGGGGNGGNTSSASSATNIFSPGSYVDYHEIGGETTIDPAPGPGAARFAAWRALHQGMHAAWAGRFTEAARLAATAAALGGSFDAVVTEALNLRAFTLVSLGDRQAAVSALVDAGATAATAPAALVVNFELLRAPADPSGASAGLAALALRSAPVSHAAVTEALTMRALELWENTDGPAEVPDSLRSALRSLVLQFTTLDTHMRLLRAMATADRQWIATDETAPDGQDVYMNFNNATFGFTIGTGPAGIVLVKSNNDGGLNTPADWAASGCNAFNALLTTTPADSDPTVCPDPADSNLWIAGPVIVDKSTSSNRHHTVYIPFERFDGTNFQLYLAISTDQGNIMGLVRAA